MQKVLREVDQQELAIALKGTDTEIQDKFFTNMSTRAAAMLKEDMEFMGPVPVSRVEKCKVSIVQKIFYLAENRDIMLISQMEAGELVKIWYSDVIHFTSEYRCPIVNGKKKERNFIGGA